MAVSRGQPRYWFLDPTEFGKEDVEQPTVRPGIATRADLVLASAALDQHDRVRELTANAENAAEQRGEKFSLAWMARQLLTMNYTQLWNVVRGLSPLTIEHEYDMQRVSNPTMWDQQYMQTVFFRHPE